MNNQFDYTPQNDFETQGFGTMPPQQPKGHSKGYAIASLCLGIASVFFTCLCCCFYYISIVLSVISIVMAFLAKRDNGGKMPGMAIAGLILAIVGLIFFILLIVFNFIISSNPDIMSEIFDPVFEESFGMSFEEYMESMENMEGYEYLE